MTCLERGNVAFSSGTPLEPGGVGYLGSTIAAAPEPIAEGSDRIVASLDAQTTPAPSPARATGRPLWLERAQGAR